MEFAGFLCYINMLSLFVITIGFIGYQMYLTNSISGFIDNNVYNCNIKRYMIYNSTETNYNLSMSCNINNIDCIISLGSFYSYNFARNYFYENYVINQQLKIKITKNDCSIIATGDENNVISMTGLAMLIASIGSVIISYMLIICAYCCFRTKKIQYKKLPKVEVPIQTRNIRQENIIEELTKDDENLIDL